MTSSNTITGRMAETLAARDAAACPPEVFAKAQLCLADFLSGAFEAAPLEWSQQAAAIAVPLADGAAMIPGKSFAVPGDAAFANAVAAHGLVREDMHTGSIAHLGVVVWPALLAALAEADRPVSGRDFLHAGIAGYEAGAAMGSALMTAELARLFRPTGMAGPFASATACSLLKRLPAPQLQAALGIAANSCAGFNEWPHSGGSEMYFHAGFAARNGLAASLLAQSGAFAAPTIIEGEAGLFRSIGRTSAPADIPLFQGDAYEIMTVFHKQAPACNYAQTPCQAALQAVQKYDGATGDITGIRIAVTHAARLYPGCDHSGPYGNILQAKMSIQYGVAATIAARAMGEANYARIGDPEIERLISLVELETDDVFTAAYPGRQGAAVTIATKDGNTFHGALDDVAKADAEEVGHRFRASATDWLGEGAANELDGFVAGILDCPDVRPLNRLCNASA